MNSIFILCFFFLKIKPYRRPNIGKKSLKGAKMVNVTHIGKAMMMQNGWFVGWTLNYQNNFNHGLIYIYGLSNYLLFPLWRKRLGGRPYTWEKAILEVAKNWNFRHFFFLHFARGLKMSVLANSCACAK